MQKIVIEDRSSGEIVAQGEVVSGNVSLTVLAQLPVAESEICSRLLKDVEEGYSGGALGNGLEWFELKSD